MRLTALKNALAVVATALCAVTATAQTSAMPGPWIQGVRSCDVEDMKKTVLREFGPDVNLANTDVRTICDTEALRVGLGTAGPLPS